MVPPRGDHDARRREVSEAVWRVLAQRGFGGLTLRAVAAELGSSTGLLTHYFPSKRELVSYALDVAEERTKAWPRRKPAGEGMTALRDAMLDVLPLTDIAVAMSKVWVSSWDAALGDSALSAVQAARYVRWRDLLQPHLVAAGRLGELPPDADPADLAVGCAAFAHGLVVQVLFDPARFPPEVQIRLLDGFLAGLRNRAA